MFNCCCHRSEWQILVSRMYVCAGFLRLHGVIQVYSKLQHTIVCYLFALLYKVSGEMHIDSIYNVIILHWSPVMNCSRKACIFNVENLVASMDVSDNAYRHSLCIVHISRICLHMGMLPVVHTQVVGTSDCSNHNFHHYLSLGFVLSIAHSAHKHQSVVGKLASWWCYSSCTTYRDWG